MKAVAAVVFVYSLLLVSPQQAEAHWCSNIWQAPARLVVRPESSTVYLPSSGSTSFRVYMGNNFPYKLNNVRLRGTASGYSVNVTPSGISMGPGQVIGFRFTVTPSGGATGDVDVSSLGIEVAFQATGGDMPDNYHNKPYDSQLNRRCMFSEEFGGSSNDWIQTNTTQAATVALHESGPCNVYQATGLAVAAVAEVAPNQPMTSSRNPVHQFTAMEQLIHMFGYRNCYSFDGRQWACFATDNCGPFGPQTSVCTPPEWTNGDDRFGQECMRAGSQLAVLYTRGLLGSYVGAARNGAINAMTGSGGCSSDVANGRCRDAYKCLGAIVGAVLWREAADASAFTAALSSGANAVPTACQDAAQRVLTGSPVRTCSSYSNFYEQAACAAAAGLRGDHGPVRDILLAQALHYDFSRLYYGYLLSIVAQYHRAQGQSITYYPDAGGPLMVDGLVLPDTRPPHDTVPSPDTGTTPPPDTGTTPPPDTGTTPPPDTGTTPPPDTGTTADRGVVADQGQPPPDRGVPVTEAGLVTEQGIVPVVDQGSQPTLPSNTLSGGCTLGPAPASLDGAIALLLPLLLLALRPRRSRERRR